MKKHMLNHCKSRYHEQAKNVWVNQKGKCPICNLPIDINVDAEERPLHHKNGNRKNNSISNLAYTHVHCHRQHHATNPKTITVA